MRHQGPGIASVFAAATLSVTLVGCSGSGTAPDVLLGDTPNLDVLALGEATESEWIAAAVEQLPGIVEDVLDQTGVLGMSVAVVRDGEVIFADGFGVREIGTDLAVTADTVFQIASLSKPISATAVAAAIGESAEELTWETPIHELLPSSAFSDEVVTHRATIGDAFSHRRGLATGAGDDLEDLGYEREEILDRLRLLPLDAFRTSYRYSNFGFTLGAEAVAASRHQSWEDLVEELVFDPIGMASSSARHDDYLAGQERPVAATAPRDLDELVGSYTNAYFGDLRIDRRGEGLLVRLGPAGATELGLDPWDGDVFSYALATENGPPGSLASAAFERTGDVVTVTLASFDENGLGTWTKAG